MTPDYKVFTAPDGTKLFEAPTGAIYRTEQEAVDNEVNAALDVITSANAGTIRDAAKNPATAPQALVGAFAVINDVFMSAAITGGAPSTPTPAAATTKAA